MTRKMKDSGIEWIGQIPEEWMIAKLKMLCNVKDGTHDTPKYVDKSDNSFPLVTSKNIKNGNIDFHDVKYISEKDYIDINKRSNVEINDVIMPMIGTVGNPAIIETESKFAIKNVALFKCNNDIYISKIIKYYLQSTMITEQFEFLNRGGVQTFISLTLLQNLICTMIPEQELIKIVNYLDIKCSKIDETLQKEKQVIEKLKQYKQSVITEAVTKGLNSDLKMKDSGIEWIGEIPEHWSISRFSFETWVRARLGWKGLKADEYVQDGYIFLATPNIKNKDIDFVNVNYIDEFRYEESPEIKLSIGDVLLTKDGSTLGTVNVVRYLPNGATVNSSIAVITPGSNLDGIFLMYQIKGDYIKKIIENKKDGMGVPHLFQKDINKIYITLPPIEEQKQIATFLDKKCASIDKAISNKEKLIEKLTEYKKSLIYECVTGKREV